MPSAQPSSQNGLSSKKQQSISSFFSKSNTSAKKVPALTPKNSAASENVPAVTPKTSTSDSPTPESNSPNNNEQSLFVLSDEDAAPTSRRPSRGVKRKSQTQNQDGEAQLPDRKRSRQLSDEIEARDTPCNNDSLYRADSPEASTLAPIVANGARKEKVSQRTSKYLFSSSPRQDEENLEDGETRRQKEKLHQKFVRKLGRPDSIAEIKRKNWQVAEETLEGAEGEEEEEEELPAKPTTTGKKGVATKKGSSKLTPMERQVVEIKKQHMDTILVVEVGYKCRFFGEDARVAAKELSIVCIPGKFRYDEHPSEAHLDRFASASIPVHRLHVHVKRLVQAGHKVGVVRQLETAALKAAGDNRNAPFVRKLTNLYTKGTYIDEVEGLEGSLQAPNGGAPATGYLLCITENNAKGWGTDEKVHVGIVAVQPATGDVIHDDFEDGFMRSEIETRLLHIAPCEFLIVGELSKATEKLVQHLSGSKTNIFGDKVRVERMGRPKTMVAQAYSHVSNFYAGKMKALSQDEDVKASTLLEKVLKLPENVTVCLSAMITHMSEYGLEHVFDLTKYFQSFSARSHMLLNGTTLTSLEIYQNQTDHSSKGSLFWTLDRTQTRFGQRLLRKWVGRPLLDRQKLEERVAAVEELKEGGKNIKVDKVQRLLSTIKSDLEKSLIRIYYGKVSSILFWFFR